MKTNPVNLQAIDFFSYEVNAALLAMQYLNRLAPNKAAGLRKISAYTGVAGIRMHAIMKTLHRIGCVEFSIEDRAGFYISDKAFDKTIGQLVYVLNNGIRINGKSYKDPQVNVEALSQSVFTAMESIRAEVLKVLDIPLREFIAPGEAYSASQKNTVQGATIINPVSAGQNRISQTRTH